MALVRHHDARRGWIALLTRARSPRCLMQAHTVGLPPHISCVHYTPPYMASIYSMASRPYNCCTCWARLPCTMALRGPQEGPPGPVGLRQPTGAPKAAPSQPAVGTCMGTMPCMRGS